MKGVPGANGIEIVSQGFTRIGSSTCRNKSKHEKRICRAAFSLWDGLKVAKNVEDQEPSSISLSSSVLPRSIDDGDQMVKV